MFRWAKEFIDYLKLVLKSWWFYIGIVMGAIRLFEKWRGIPIPLPHSAMLTAGISGLFMAQWSAFKSLLGCRSSKIEKLASLIAEGRNIRRHYSIEAS